MSNINSKTGLSTQSNQNAGHADSIVGRTSTHATGFFNSIGQERRIWPICNNSALPSIADVSADMP